jgi:hypothetical protein
VAVEASAAKAAMASIRAARLVRNRFFTQRISEVSQVT